MDIIIGLLLGGIAGWLAGLIRRGEGFGIIGNIVIGIIGGLVGSLVFGLFGLEGTNIIGSLIVSTIGAIILLAILNFFTGGKK